MYRMEGGVFMVFVGGDLVVLSCEDVQHAAEESNKKATLGTMNAKDGTSADAKSGEYGAMHERDHLSAIKGAREETSGWPRIRNVWMHRGPRCSLEGMTFPSRTNNTVLMSECLEIFTGWSRQKVLRQIQM